MQRTSAIVERGLLYQPTTGADPIVVGTTAWFDWLEQHTIFTFVDRVFGDFLARKRSTAAGEWELQEWGTQQGQFYRGWLGPSRTLTLARLQDTAHTLADQHDQEKPPSVAIDEEDAAAWYLTPSIRARHDLASSLLHTKFARPRIPSDVIPRPRLLERLSAGLGGAVTLLCAPAGYGKTTLLVQWLATISRSVAWISLEAGDDELPVFVNGLSSALQRVVPDACRASASLLHSPQFPSLREVVPLLVSDLADVPEDVLVVLDDYHLIQQREIHELLQQLIEHLPPQLHLVLSSRTEPPLPLARWRARGQLQDLRAADMRFTLQETEIFLARLLGGEQAHQVAGMMAERTEGWVAVVRLAALSLRGRVDPAAFLERLSHSPDRTMNRYLVEEALAQQAPVVQEVLERTSILGQFNAELGAATLGGEVTAEQVQALLDEVERTNLFVVPLDERQGWYRFHYLFQAVLEGRLQAHVSPEELAGLHRRASAWYARQGLIDEALHHALAAGDSSAAAQLVEAQFLWAFEQEQWGQLDRWLRLLPEEQIRGSPGLLVARAWVSEAQGQLEDFARLLTAAERLVATNGSGAPDLGEPPSWPLHALIAIGRSHLQYFSGRTQASLESARYALQWLSSGEEFVANMALRYLVWSQQATGQEEVALVALNKALRAISARQSKIVHLLFTQAYVYLAAGKLPQLERTARHLLLLARGADLVLSQNYAHWLLGVVSYEWNDLYTAAYHFSVVVTDRHRAHMWVVRAAMYGLALAYQAQGLGREAQESMGDLLALVQEQHNLSEITTAYAFCGELALLQDEVESAQQWLELAGEQVVQEPMTFLVDRPITTARLWLAQGEEESVARGQALLVHLLQQMEAMHSTRKIIKVLALQAWAFQLQGRLSEALEVLERALELGRPAGFIRVFADLPRLAPVLHELRKRRRARQPVDGKLGAYLQRILAAMIPLPAQAMPSDELLRREGLEPLTERELHILHLLDRDLTNKEIARELAITPGTVKAHTNNLYRKLGVNNRRAAVALAKALGLLVVNQTSGGS
jgi:LuxR family transcriptional regulator, maltose regulon positive regulatory protein